MGEKFAAIELVQTALHLLPKPYIMVDIVFDKLLNIMCCIRVGSSGGAIYFGLKFRVEDDFHSLSLP